jgi:1-aminocyclopropane-1-carboxylate deaminase/D-cysteine desulfhydrase-like pyridoxal-dependent ACC family enzyme
MFGGNKIRKLQYVMADVQRKRATTVVTIGGIQSNHARITAMAARRLGLKVVLVLNGKIPKNPSSNFYINKLLGADIYAVKTRKDRESRMNEVAEELERKGERVYKIPLGCSDEIGSCGLVGAMEEVYKQQKQMGLAFDSILIASSSGGTQAGLEVGKRLFDMEKLRIMGISSDEPAEKIKRSIIDIVQSMFFNMELDNQIDDSDLYVDENYIGEGYGIPTDKSEEASRLFSQAEGILLDPIYTGKVGAALIDYCRNGVFKPDNHVLFWHTGGLMALFS